MGMDLDGWEQRRVPLTRGQWLRRAATVGGLVVGVPPAGLLLLFAVQAEPRVTVAAVAVVVGVWWWRAGRRPAFNDWLTMRSWHGRGSCQWLIWRGELAGHPCPGCLALMGRRERRWWQERMAVSVAPATAGAVPVPAVVVAR